MTVIVVDVEGTIHLRVVGTITAAGVGEVMTGNGITIVEAMKNIDPDHEQIVKIGKNKSIISVLMKG